MRQTIRQRYTAEFKAQALELLQTGKPVGELAEELCISSQLLYRWRHCAQAEAGAVPPSGGRPPEGGAPALDALQALRRENAQLRQENEILKKAAIILGTRPLSNGGK